MTEGDRGEWTTVKKRRGRRPAPPHQPPRHLEEDDLTVEKVLHSLKMARAELEAMDFTGQCVDLIRSAVDSVKTDTKRWTMQGRNREGYSQVGPCPVSVVGYGVGSFASCPVARHQLALLCIITDSLQVPRWGVSVYDPVFSPVETESLSRLGVTLLTCNEEGKRQVRAPTVFYMPHCGKALSNNLLWANWEPLRLANLVVVGNSLSSVVSCLPSRILDRDYSLIHKASAQVEEVGLPPLPPRLTDVFNDTSIHRFPPNRFPPHHDDHDGGVVAEKGGFWDRGKEPTYSQMNEVEIILNSHQGSR